LSRAASEYKLAGIGWFGYLKQDENAPDAYESRYWLADSRRQYVRIQVVLHKLAAAKFPEPSKKDVDEALAAAIDVRDSNEDDRFLDNAAFFVVDVSDVDRDLAYQRFEETRGTSGVQKREAVKFDSEDPATRKLTRDPIPPVVSQSIQARDEYVQRVPPNLDPQKNGIQYAFYAGETYFLYGHFDLARQRFEPMWKEHCGKDEFGYKAWEKLITMSNLEGNADLSTQLAEAEKKSSCAVSAEQTAKAGLIVNPTLQEAAFVNARRKFEEAKKAPAGPEKNRLWREAAALYEAALQAAPARDEAPEAAMNAAYAYKQVGEYNKAIELYNKFITEYGSDARLTALQKGDPKTKVAPDPKKYAERVGYLGDAYDALGTTYYSFFNYQRAAETYEKVSGNERFAEQKRREAARNAMILYANMGQREKMMGEYRKLAKLNPTPDDKANGDYLVASFDYKQWDPKGSGAPNTQSRGAAEGSLMAYYQANRTSAGAGKYLVEAAYAVAKMKRTGGEGDWRTWYTNTINAWDNYKAKATVNKDGINEAQLAPYVDYAAEAAYTILDEEIVSKYEQPDKHKYVGSVADVMGTVDEKTGKFKSKGRYLVNAEEAQAYDKKLDDIQRKFTSLEWVPAIEARRGTLFDTLRSGLYFAKVKTLNAQQQAALDGLRKSGRPDLEEKADAIEDAIKDAWRKKRDEELAGADELMVRHYANAVALGRKYNVRNALITKAIGRLAYYTDILGDANMSKYVTNTPDPTNKGASKLGYTQNQYVQTRPGLAVLPPPQGNAKPLPAAP
jgi:tetratricopeptide (TPR) repeat protein